MFISSKLVFWYYSKTILRVESADFDGCSASRPPSFRLESFTLKPPIALGGQGLRLQIPKNTISPLQISGYALVCVNTPLKGLFDRFLFKIFTVKT